MAQNSPNMKSIYDYIYLDDEKIAYLSSQVFEHGLLTGASLSDNKASKNSTTTKGMANTVGEGSLDKSVLSVLLGSAKVSGGASLGVDYTVGSDLNSGLIHSYDTKFLAARNLLNKLDEDGYINKDLDNIRPCSLVLLQGELDIFDLNLFTKAVFPFWELQRTQMEAVVTDPEIKKELAELKKSKSRVSKVKSNEEYLELEKQIRKLEEQHSKVLEDLNNMKQAQKQAELHTQVMQNISNVIRFRLTAQDKIFSSLIKSSDLKLDLQSHIIKSGEKWHGLVFCLALIEKTPLEDERKIPLDDSNEIESDSKFELLNPALDNLREFVGIYPTDYRITPIMVFRKIV